MQDDLPELPPDTVLASLGRFATRHEGSRWLDALAMRASRGQFGARDLIHRARDGRWGRLNRRDLAWFGYLLAAAPHESSDVTDVLAILDHALQAPEAPAVGPRLWSLYLQALYLSGQTDPIGALGADRLHLVDQHVLWSVRTDVLNPFLHEKTSSRELWLRSLNRPFTLTRAAPVTLREEDQAPFDLLTCVDTPAAHGDLVSVIMPVFNPDQSLLTAVRSVLEQTWTDIELLLCDDGSTAGRELIDEAARADHRVRVLRSEQNAGAYSAQNRGLTAARGRYLTIHGADDFSHAQRIERHICAMEASGAVATLSHSVRASARLALTALGRSPRRVNLSSLFFERDVVLPALGGFDSVRRAADTEFVHRIKARFSPQSVVTLDEPLAIVQTTPDSLSRNDFGMLYRHPARDAYRVGFDGWHAQIAGGDASALVHPPARAPFPAPSHISGAGKHPDAAVDIVFLANPMVSAPIDLGRIVQECAAAGIRMALVEFVGVDDARRPPRPPGDALAVAVANGDLRWVLPNETVTGRVAVMLDAQALPLMSEHRLADIRVDHLFLAASCTGDANAVRTRIRASSMGIPHVHWLPFDEHVARSLRDLDPDASIAPPAQWHLAPLGTPLQRLPRQQATTTDIGMVAARGVPRPVRQRWTEELVPRDLRNLLYCYGRGPTRLAGRSIERLSPEVWSRSAFLGRMQYLLAPPLPIPKLTALVVAAWAHGVVVLAQEDMRPHLADRALYPAGEPDSLICQLQSEPDRCRKIQDRATRWVAARATSKSLVASVRSLLSYAAR